MQESENILRIFKEVKIAIEQEDSDKLSDLSNQTINTASRTHDPDNIATAVVVYALGKIVGRKEYRKYKTWKKFYQTTLTSVDAIIYSLKNNDEIKFRKNLQNIRSSIRSLSGDLKKYIDDVFIKASINKASRIYEHGISMEKTASLLGITMYELAAYAGQKGIANDEAKTIGVKTRIKWVEEVFSWDENPNLRR